MISVALITCSRINKELGDLCFLVFLPVGFKEVTKGAVVGCDAVEVSMGSEMINATKGMRRKKSYSF